MQIPLDYYRILGIPLQAESDLITSAYEDRIRQIPHREYSEYGIKSRQSLITYAYNILRDEKSRHDYDEMVFPTALFPEEDSDFSISEAVNLFDTESINPTIDIENSQFIGALIMLQELGEYELVLSFAQLYLDGKEKLMEISQQTDTLPQIWQDLILTVVNTDLELAREKWQQQEYNLADDYLVSAYTLLVEENCLLSLRQEIYANRCKLRPYVILQLLTHHNSELKDRHRALDLLSEMLDARGGIEGKQDDQSGLNTNDFLRFIQQIRSHLTAEQQEEFFATEATRPSNVAQYFLINALMVMGFTQRKPEYILEAKKRLIKLNYYQDVYIEQSICAFLLGEIAQSQVFLKQSTEIDKVNFVLDKSADSLDLVPGLLLYTEKWFNDELAGQFKNLAQESLSVQMYFEDERVQNYLENIAPLDDVIAGDSAPHTLPASLDDIAVDVASPDALRDGENASTATIVAEDNGDLVSFDSFLSESPPDNDIDLDQKQQKSGLPVNIFFSIVVLVLLGILVNVILSNFASLLSSSRRSDLQLSLTEPLIQLPEEIMAQEAIGADNPLTAEGAGQTIKKWLEAKSQATGPDHNIIALDSILVDPLLSIWRDNVSGLKKQNAYRSYEHDITVESVNVNPQNRNEGNITARVREKSEFFSNGRLNNPRSYNEEILVQYQVIKINNQWFIQNAKIID